MKHVLISIIIEKFVFLDISIYYVVHFTVTLYYRSLASFHTIYISV